MPTPTPEGYRDLMFTVKMSNSHVCEVQLHLSEMMAAKKSGAGHKMYKVCRRVLANPMVDEDTYCKEVKDGTPCGEGERNEPGRLGCNAHDVDKGITAWEFMVPW